MFAGVGSVGAHAQVEPGGSGPAPLTNAGSTRSVQSAMISLESGVTSNGGTPKFALYSGGRHTSRSLVTRGPLESTVSAGDVAFVQPTTLESKRIRHHFPVTPPMTTSRSSMMFPSAPIATTVAEPAPGFGRTAIAATVRMRAPTESPFVHSHAHAW